MKIYKNLVNKSVFRPTSNQNQMSFSNPIQFKNNQTFNPNYANQLQEQFYNITQFVQESSYDPSKKNSTSEKKNSFEENAVNYNCFIFKINYVFNFFDFFKKKVR